MGLLLSAESELHAGQGERSVRGYSELQNKGQELKQNPLSKRCKGANVQQRESPEVLRRRAERQVGVQQTSPFTYSWLYRKSCHGFLSTSFSYMVVASQWSWVQEIQQVSAAASHKFSLARFLPRLGGTICFPQSPETF